MLHAPAVTPEAGILSIADAYVAMISPRLYRGAMLAKDAIAVVEAGAGAQWDPYLVQIFLDRFAHEAREAG